jgi:predicted GNAT family acetyltransferase
VPRVLTEHFSLGVLSRIEDAGLNASAPPQQRWLDGWLLRFSPGKAKRARCINAVAAGRWPLADKLRWAAAAYRDAGLPMAVRITPFTLPASLDAELAALGMPDIDDTRVMVCATLAGKPPPLPADTHWRSLAADDYAAAVGELRGSPIAQQQAHAERLRISPVPYQGFAICRDGDGAVLACGQVAREAELIGLYDVFTRADERGHGLATQLCGRLLTEAAAAGSRLAYLQVEGDNHAARHIYHRLGFTDAYSYHYRMVDSNSA